MGTTTRRNMHNSHPQRVDSTSTSQRSKPHNRTKHRNRIRRRLTRKTSQHHKTKRNPNQHNRPMPTRMRTRMERKPNQTRRRRPLPILPTRHLPPHNTKRTGKSTRSKPRRTSPPHTKRTTPTHPTYTPHHHMTSALTKNGSTRKWRRIAKAILRRDNYTCHWCGAHATTADHINPRALGGDDNPANLVAACTTCNYRRGGQLAQALRRTKTEPFLATGTTPVRMSWAANPQYPRGVYGYSVSNRQGREKRDGE